MIPYNNKLTGDIVSPDGNEDVLPGENFGTTKWSEDLIATAEETLYALFRDCMARRQTGQEDSAQTLTLNPRTALNGPTVGSHFLRVEAIIGLPSI